MKPVTRESYDAMHEEIAHDLRIIKDAGYPSVAKALSVYRFAVRRAELPALVDEIHLLTQWVTG